ncbi:S9 family peptidase [Chitinophaga costaii]|nr:S9 family peptidase [Chitinophaga costaii]
MKCKTYCLGAAITLLPLLLATAVKAQVPEAPPQKEVGEHIRHNDLTLEDIYNSGIYNQKGFGPVRWLNTNDGYSALEKSAAGNEIVKYEAATGQRIVLVAAQQLTPAGWQHPLEVASYAWSADNRKMLLFTNTFRVWRYNTRGDYWVLNLATGQLQQLGKNLDAGSLMFAKFSPDGGRVAYVSHQNIFVEDIATQHITQLTTDGGNNIINGTFDWVYEEELDCRDGFRWSPDGQFIAYWQTDTEGTGVFYMINNIDSIYSQPIPLPYPKVGTRLSAVKIGVIPAAGGATKWLDIPGAPRDHYLARMDFIPASSTLMIQQLNRKQNANKVWMADMLTMKLTNILTDTDSAFLDLHDDIQWLDHNRYFTWSSEQDGWQHLYKVSRDGKQKALITKGNFDVVQVNCIDEKGGYVYYIASPFNYTQRFLYRSRLDGKGSAERITPSSLRGQSSYQMSGNARWAIHTYQDANTPPRISLVHLPDHQEWKVLEDNHTLKERYAGLGLSPKKFFQVNIGEVVLDAWMITPKNFDSTKKYPLLFYVYGEPAASTVQDNWGGGDLWHQYLAQQGYVVMSIDSRGTKTPRGRAWRKSVYGQIGLLSADDQAMAAAKIRDSLSYIDPHKIGIWGWSGGGQMTLHCMFRHSDIYTTGIAVSFVSDQRLYDATYQERYMGLLSENKEGYIKGSPITYANGLQGNLMIIHGTGDDNVHYQSFELLVNRLIKYNKLFAMMSYPMRSHGIYERENTSLHLRETMEKFWKQNLQEKKD